MKIDKKFTLVLGSKSPRRKELLGWIEVPFNIKVSDIDEISSKKVPSEIAKDIATQKGRNVLRDLIGQQAFDSLVVGADTIVCLDDQILGKPKDDQDARKMLTSLAGRIHEVITAVWIGRVDEDQKSIISTAFSCSTKVHFGKIDNDLMDNYIKSGDSLDKAGAYGIQGQSLTFIDHLEGSYSNVVGFPLDMFINELKKFLDHSDDMEGAWRKHFK